VPNSNDLQLCCPYLCAPYGLFQSTVQFAAALKRCAEHNAGIQFFLKCSKSVATSGAAGEPVRVTQNLPTRIAASGHVLSLAVGMWGRVDILKCSVILHGPTDRRSATVAWSGPKWGFMVERRNLLPLVYCLYNLSLCCATPCSFTSRQQRFNERSASFFKIEMSTYQIIGVAMCTYAQPLFSV
jgi:hypothetical protein